MVMNQFAVKLKLAGGRNGTHKRPANYRYDVFDYSTGNKLGKNKKPEMPRPNGRMLPATLGRAMRDGRKLVLFDALEVVETSA